MNQSGISSSGKDISKEDNSKTELCSQKLKSNNKAILNKNPAFT
jgi:hypothetical protein